MKALLRKIDENKKARTIRNTLFYVVVIVLAILLIKFIITGLFFAPITNWWGSLGWGGKIIAIWLGLNLVGFGIHQLVS